MDLLPIARDSADSLAQELRLNGVLTDDEQQRLVADAFFRFARGILAVTLGQAAALP